MPSEESPTTLATVAASAGVSVATVSKVLNGRSDVGPETRARVQELLERHDYVERRADRAPAHPAGQPTVELVLHGTVSAYTQEVLQGVLAAAPEAGVSVAISVRPRQPRPAGRERSAAWVRQLVTSGRRAVLDVSDDLQQGDLAELLRVGLPVVVIDPLQLPRADVPSVGATNFAGGLAATRHLVDLGHRRIGYLGADAQSTYNQARMQGYRAALEGAATGVPDGLVRVAGPTYEDGRDGGLALLQQPDRPTAIFAATDLLAAGVVEAARRRGLRVPQDLSVVGFDDTELAPLLSPPLTTVHQPLREMGALALRTALRLASGESLDSHHVELATRLVVRESTAPPAGSAAAATVRAARVR